MIIICPECSTEFDVNDNHTYISYYDDPEAAMTIGFEDSNDVCPTCGYDPFGDSYQDVMYQQHIHGKGERHAKHR